MKVGIIQLGRDEQDYGLSLVCSKTENVEYYTATRKTARVFDVLIASVFWWEHLYLLADWLRCANIHKSQKNRPRIVVGGFNSFSPAPLYQYADVVVVGDGEGLLMNAIEGGKHESFYYGETAVYRQAEKVEPFSNTTGTITRIEISRGCRSRCKFCSVSWLKKYRETEKDAVVELIAKAPTKRISLFSPCPQGVKWNTLYDLTCKRYKKTRVDADMRMDGLDLHKSIQPISGIEGLSERLRISIGKGYTNDFIVDQTEKLFSAGKVKSAEWYFILDLPGETEDDWDQADELFTRLSCSKVSGLVFLFPNVFAPKPHTPLENCGIHWDRDYYSKWQSRWKKINNGSGIRVMAKTRVHGPESRVLEMMALRSGPEFYEIESLLTKCGAIRVMAGADNSNKRIKAIDKIKFINEISKLGGPERWCSENPTEKPWKRVTVKR